MGPMQSGLNFTDRIVKYVAKWAERKPKLASPSKGHVIPPIIIIIKIVCIILLYVALYVSCKQIMNVWVMFFF